MRVDNYDFVESNTLRWRSRLPSDPEFANARLTYELHYSLDYVLLQGGDNAYTLDHDFAFPDREGVIEKFTLRLAIDPVWKLSAGSSPLLYEATSLEPGRGHVVTLPLEYTAAGRPAGVRFGAPMRVRRAGMTAIPAAILVILIVFLLGERRHGRFERVAEKVDEDWLRTHVLSFPPEVIGARWEKRPAPPRSLQSSRG